MGSSPGFMCWSSDWLHPAAAAHSQLSLSSSGLTQTCSCWKCCCCFCAGASHTADMIPKNRLGKRSPLGALVSATAGPRADQETGETSVITATGAGQHAVSRVKGHPGLKCGGAGESSGLVDQIDLMQSDVSVWSSSHPSSSSSSPSSVPHSVIRSVSSCIDVPRNQRTPADVDMDEMMAAMVLSSLSCSPLLHNSAQPDPAAPLMDCGGSELSDSGSSGYWSVGHGNGSPAHSPTIAEPDAGPASPPDEGLDMELEQVLFDEPAPRKRRNSVKVAYRCLWPSCGKVLTSVVGIKRHIRTTHLCRGGEHERCSRSEEDFYYTEINQQQPQTPPLPLHCVRTHSPTSPNSLSPSSPPSPPPPSPPSPPHAACSALSRSAPSSSGFFWQVHSEHSYQAPGHVEPAATAAAAAAAAAAVLTTASCRLMAAPTTCNRQGLSFRVRSVSVGEQWLQQQSAPCRRTRGEAKKCRKVYGIEHRDQWCTACRWKKACQRFLD
ncbi:zinc finger protein 395-like isoform X2 [Scomber scombrus]|uniref:zinc finger protein 395-like isoform X2 n=1 Tax=Scomber scombrus TaxID=13677 RepID=UPI002DDACBFA|nr:zinc finger protein 395-like isoform X2 [Scomber scombrus]